MADAAMLIDEGGRRGQQIEGASDIALKRPGFGLDCFFRDNQKSVPAIGKGVGHAFARERSSTRGREMQKANFDFTPAQAAGQASQFFNARFPNVERTIKQVEKGLAPEMGNASGICPCNA
jgi:hypothetical protein